MVNLIKYASNWTARPAAGADATAARSMAGQQAASTESLWKSNHV